MSDPVVKPGEGGSKGEVDMTKFVPKDDHEKLATQVKTLETSKKELESKLDEAKLSLIDPKYVEFLESQKGRGVAKKIDKAISDISEDDIESLSSKQLLGLAISKAKDAVMTEIIPQYEDALKKQGATISDILAVLELQQVEGKYEDFDDYREDIKKILETSKTPLTIDQAYLQAKGAKPPVSDDKDSKDGKKPKPSSDKPGGPVPGDMKQKDFESAEEAGEDAWNSVVGSDKDII